METDKNTVVPMDEAKKEAQKKIVNLSDPESIKEKYGEVYEITVVVDEDDENEGRKLVYYFKRPSTASFNRYLKGAGKNMAASTTNFVIDNIIEEQMEPLKTECEKYPGLALNLGQKLLSACGLGDNVNFRKL